MSRDQNTLPAQPRPTRFAALAAVAAALWAAAPGAGASELPDDIITGSIAGAEVRHMPQVMSANPGGADRLPVDPRSGALLLWDDFQYFDPVDNTVYQDVSPRRQPGDPDVAAENPHAADIAPTNSFRFLDQLNSSWSFGDWQVSHAFGQELRSGALDFTPQLGYRHTREDGSVIAPRVALKGVWDLGPFVGAIDEAELDGFGAEVQGGVTFFDLGGWSVDASTSVGNASDPGSSLEWRTNLGVSVPLN